MTNTPTPAQALGDLEEVARDRFRNGDEYSAAILRRCGQHFAGLENRAELLAEDIECFHMAMDDLGAPRDDGSNVYSMIGRANKLVEAAETRVEMLQAINAANAGELDGIRKLTAPLFNDVDPIHGVSSRAPNVSITPYGYVRDVVKQLEAARARVRELESALLRHGRHEEVCETRHDSAYKPNPKCTCGFAAFLAARGERHE